MADIPGLISKINDIEVSFDASVSEQLMNKFGANINALIDVNTASLFLTSGAYNIPLNATRLLVAACGAGGGGASGGASPGGAYGPTGGSGCLMSIQLIPVTGTEVAVVTIGAGGAGGAAAAGEPGNPGAAGGDTIFSNPTDGSRIWAGARGGQIQTSSTAEEDRRKIEDSRPATYHTLGGFRYTDSGAGLTYFDGVDGLFPGGVTSTVTGGANRSSGGGGGSSTFGQGGAGSDSVFSAISSAPGGDAAATAYGAGGGASGVGGGPGGGKGGDGAPGFLFILRALT